jgi:hypothetical protein
MNTEVVQHGVNGFVCVTPADWETSIRKLLAEAGLRQQLGQAARATVEQCNLMKVNTSNFLVFFNKPNSNRLMQIEAFG